MAVLTRREFVAPRRGPRADAAQPPRDFWLRIHRRAMACRFEITLAGERAADVPAARRALDRIDEIEAQLTVFRGTSTVAQLNRTAAAAPVPVERDLLDLLSLCATLYDATGGAFDITSAPLSRCWGFLRREGRLPTSAEIDTARACVGMDHVRVDRARGVVSFDREGVEINLGAVGKGWALDRIAATLAADGVRHALLSAGHSSIRAIGGEDDGFHVSLRSARVDEPLAQVMLRRGALGTSGAGVQFFEAGGKRYGHVIDPRTGWPAEGALSVSVLTTSAAAADALSTAFFAGGEGLARAYCAAHRDVLVVFTPDTGARRTVLIGDFAGADVEVV